MAWDPLMADVRAQMLASVPMTSPRMPWMRKVWAGICRRVWMVRERWLDALLYGTVAALWLTGIGAVFWGHSSTMSSSPYIGIVAGAATATAFSGTIASALAIPFNAASGIGASYTSELLRRPYPWLAGGYLAVQAGGLFTLAAMGPDRGAATGAGLLAAAAFGLVWVVVRRVLTAADLYQIALRQAAFQRRNSRRGAAHLERMMLRRIPRRDRSEALVDRMIRPGQQQWVSTILQHQREGFRRMESQSRPVECAVFWESMVATFTDHAADSHGKVGPQGGPARVLFLTLDELVSADSSGVRDEVATKCINTIGVLAAFESNEYEYGGVRSGLISHLERWVTRTWNNDFSTIPDAGIRALGEIHEHFARYGDYADADNALRAIARLTERAMIDRRKHIAMAGMDCVVAALLACASNPNDVVRVRLLAQWERVAGEMATLRIADFGELFMRPSEVLLPGIAVNRKVGLQQVLGAIVRLPSPAPQHAYAAVARWLRKVNPELAAVKAPFRQSPVQEVCALIYCTAVWAIPSVPDAAARRAIAEDLRAACTEWTAASPDPVDLRELLLKSGDVGEVLWSAMASVAFLGQDRQLFSDGCRVIFEGLALDAGSDPLFDDFGHALVKGLMLGADVPEETFMAVDAATAPDDPFGGGWEMHIKGFPSAPRMNRNQVEVPEEVLEAIENWLCASFPLFLEQEPFLKDPPATHAGDASGAVDAEPAE